MFERELDAPLELPGGYGPVAANRWRQCSRNEICRGADVRFHVEIVTAESAGPPGTKPTQLATRSG